MMKKAFLSLGFILIGSFLVHAQQVDNVQRGQRGYVPPIRYNQSTYIELKDPLEETDRIMAKCVEALSLDDFQKEIMKNMVMKKIEDENAILSDKENSREARQKKIIERDKAFAKELGSILSPEQVEQYKTMDLSETREDKKEKKKRKKRNKKVKS
ncbi:MAG: hypothetical protein HKO90_11405 [Flavobacteriaceae bacterium]|nr:hypothetical protein [Bacteroidia bacterium]NNK88881.1 hypothetical protein [Flavobacteriaceae bacterium]